MSSQQWAIVLNDSGGLTFFFILREEVVNYLIEKNPADYIKPPRHVRKDVSCFKIEHLEKLFDDDSKYSRMFQFDLWTGLRRGELLSLTWTNVTV